MDYYFRNTGSQSASTGTNYSLTSGGPSAGVVPGSSDTVIFDSNSGDCTIDAAGITWGTLFIRTTKTFTLTNSLTVTTLTFDNVLLTATFNVSNLNVTNMNIANGTTTVGTSKIVCAVSGGVISIGGVSGLIRNNIDFNANLSFVSASGNVVLNFGAASASTQNVTKLSGTITVNSAVTFNLNSAASNSILNVDLSGISFTNFNINSLGTINFISNITLVNISWGISANCTTNGSIIYCSGTSNSTNNITPAGTTVLRMVGTGSLASSGAVGAYNKPVVIDTLGTITIGTDLRFNGTGSLQYIAGSIVSTGSTISVLSGTGVVFNTGSAVFNNYSQPNTSTITLSSNLRFAGNVTIGVSGQSPIVNGSGFNVYVGGTGGFVNCSGTAKIIMNGTGGLTGGGNFSSNTDIDTAGTITIGNLGRVGGTLKYVTGTTIVTAGTTLALNSTCIIDTQGASSASPTNTSTTGINWSNVTLGAGTVTNNSNLTCLGNFLVGTNPSINGSNVYLYGNIGMNSTYNASTANFFYKGTGIWNNGNQGATWTRPFTIDTTGTLTLQNTIIFSGSTLTHVNGTVVTTGSTINLASNVTVSGNVNWNNITVSTGGTVTLNSLLLVLGTLNITNSATFNGSSGFTAANLTITSPGLIITLLASRTYTVTTSLVLTGSATLGRIRLQSSTTSYAFFNLQPGASQNVQNCDATWINSAGGSTIYTTINSILSNTVNWNLGSPNTNFLTFF